ncbi:MAG: T9SS type A sorting domain-containing protein, partial [Bacteroidota bacterium]
VDLSKRDTVLDFIYFAPPEAMITAGLDPYSATCNEIVLEQETQRTVTIRVRESYYGGTCDVDTAAIRIINGFSDVVKDTTLSHGSVKYKFKVGAPNPSPPYKKTFQVIATTLSGNESSTFVQGIVTGIRSKANTFTTALPETPELILHDPPGDGSSSYLERDSQFCTVYSAYLDYEVGGGGGITFDNGPEIKIVAAPLGVGEIITTDAIISGTIEGVVTYQNISDTSFQVCRSFSQRISTSDDELVVGEQGGDVFVGSGINIDFGFADQVTFNEAACAGQAQVVLNVAPKDYATTFMYSEWNIHKNIKYLMQLANAATDQTLKTKYLNSITSWTKILADNDSLKAKAPFRRNISFDAGVVYEYSEASETESDSTKNTAVNSEGSTSGHLGFDLNGVGVTADLKFVYATSAGGIKGNHRQKALKTGYILADNDPGDAFSVDVAMDSKYNTPVFRTKVGQSSCPYEKNTAHRESPNLQLGANSTATVVDIPSNEAAVYKFFLGNTSETNETRTYALEAKPESNPDGAVIKLNGAVLNDVVSYEVEYGMSIPITITIERGPVAYDYDNLELAFFSSCEDERATALGIKSDQDPVVYSKILLGAHFIKPCTEVNINVPEQDWLINSDTTLRITVSGYTKSETDFSKIRLQYRRAQSDGAWINIVGPSNYPIQVDGEIVKANLGNVFTQFFWKTSGLSDGAYEIRAVAICTGDAQDKPGVSAIIHGRIDRTPPNLVGTPQPSDGVFNVGDEISFSFNEEINCAKFGQAIPAYVGLFDAVTNTPLGYNATCYSNKIVINPIFQNQFFENHILRAELHNIEDLAGNKSTAFEWEFYVDRNELGWLTDSVGMTKYVEQTKTVTAAIHNRGGSPVPFTIQNVPDWIRVVPNAGTLAPNEIRQISFTADSSLAFGLWSDSIKLHTETGQNPFFMGGDEYIPVGVRVICRPPNWDLDAGIYESTMNMVLEVNIQGQKSTDPEDVVGAFINGQLRGRANVEYVPQVGKYLAYLTIYGDVNDNLDPVLLQVWDASECVLFGTIQETFNFQADNVIGIPTNPKVIHTNSLVLREVPFRYGWNWLSFNLQFPNSNINAVLASLDHPDNDLMKSQTQFSTYGGGWFGSLTTIGNNGMYVFKADLPDTLQMLGNMIDPATTNIPLVQGWNWIGYIPNYALPINDALSSVAAQSGDLIKSQTAFAQYINNAFGWVGNLKFMEAPNGYQLKISNPGTLTYPPAPFTNNPIVSRGNPVPASHWSVNPALYENNATLIGMLSANNVNITAETMELGAFVGDEVRGAAQAVYIEPLNAYLFFLTTYANASGELLHFKLYDQANGSTQNLTETMYFSPDNHQGSISSPVPFSLQTSGTTEARVMESFDIQPNPFKNRTTFRFALPQDEDIALAICDLNGREISRLRTHAREGINMVDWDGKSDTGTVLTSGIYLVRLETAEGAITRKVVLQR